MLYLIYFLVIIIANSVGAISGMGGGVIIKPVLDTLGAHPLAAITFYSSVAVFTMSISSTIRQIQNGVRIDLKRALGVSLGSLIGGVLGQHLFQILLTFFSSENRVQLVQIILTIIMLILVLIYTRPTMKTWHLERMGYYIVLGVFLGLISTLLGIGGGPINVTLLMLLFSMPIKEATVYSIITIFFSQLANLLTIALTPHQLAQFDLQMLWAIIPAAILGGLIGGRLSGLLSDKKVLLVYRLVIIFVISLNLFNAF